MNTVEENSNNNNSNNNNSNNNNSNNNNSTSIDPDIRVIEYINRQYVPLPEHESDETDDSLYSNDDPKRRVKLKVFRPPRKERINAFYVLWFYYMNPTNMSKVNDYINIGSSTVKQQVLNHLYMGQKNYRNKNHQYSFGAHLLQSYYQKIAMYPMRVPIGVTTKTALRRKFDLLKYYMDNTYITETHRNEILSIFCCIQKIYHWLNRRVFYRKWKKSTVVVNTDLAFNELDPKKRNVFVLYQHGKRFYFHIQELLRVIRNALSQEFEDTYTVTSHYPKNPYNKVFLSNCDLYNFYFHLKYNVQGMIPIFYELWFLEQFDLPQYTHKHELLLKRMCILNHVRYASVHNRRLQNDVVGLLREYESGCPWKIDNRFPASILLQTFRPYLYLYYLFHYEALEYGIMDQYENILYAKLKDAYMKYPLYGTRKATIQKYGELPQSAFTMDDNNRISLVQEPIATPCTPRTPSPVPIPISSVPDTIHNSSTAECSLSESPVSTLPAYSPTQQPFAPISPIVARSILRNIREDVTDENYGDEDDVQDWLRRFLELGPEIWDNSIDSSIPTRLNSTTTTTTPNTTTNTTTTANEKKVEITEFNVSDIFYTECLAFNSWNVY